MPTHQNIQNLGASGLYGTNTTYGGGGQAVARSELDFLRMGVGRVPSAEYPDGYLATIRTRRDDRGRPNSTSENVLDKLKTRIGQRSYQRGVHRGERVDISDYYYADGLGPEEGILRQMRGKQFGNVIMTPKATVQTRLAPAPHLPNDGKSNMKGTSPAEIDETRALKMRGLTPSWR